MNKEILPAVAAIIFNSQGEVLLQKRKDRNKWNVISGHIEFGESAEQAMLREIKEEIDTEARIVRLIGIYSLPEFQTYTYDDRTVHYVTVFFEAHLLTPLDENLTNGETKNIKFFPVDATPDDMDLINPNWLRDALDRRSQPYIR
ncbi:MAG TPA: NUDIX domain-containing protein [Ohtaekwangia sp.]|nr:NUDIX domain-containing protein [Ohtaekwangia sp.]